MAVRRARLDIESYVRLTELADYIVPFALRVICDIGLADHLVDGPRPVDELAEATGTHAPSLHRALRALACRGIFTETEPGTFALTPLAEPLRADHPFSVQECFPLMPPDVMSWGRMDHSLRTGEPAFEALHGTGYYDYFTAPERAEDARRFELSSESVNPFVLRTVLPAYDWGSMATLVDVGGGYGTFATGLLERHPHMSATILDQPHIAEVAKEKVAAGPVADRCTVTGGDFFESVPAGAEGYLLKTVLHDWDDERAGQILRAVRAAMAPESRLVVVESLREDGDDADDVGKVMDVKAMVLFGGHARTQEEFDALFAAAGLRRSRVVATPTMTVLEARAV
ncbi:methyltransferase [Salinactinospora qingdaonensis]|uniref:Methyltransferase n=1 Tax=Salinactinospora qingdaonensis TaxID=702744 RepID=A0ABP7FCL3_9ACTN